MGKILSLTDIARMGRPKKRGGVGGFVIDPTNQVVDPTFLNAGLNQPFQYWGTTAINRRNYMPHIGKIDDPTGSEPTGSGRVLQIQPYSNNEQYSSDYQGTGAIIGSANFFTGKQYKASCWIYIDSAAPSTSRTAELHVTELYSNGNRSGIWSTNYSAAALPPREWIEITHTKVCTSVAADSVYCGMRLDLTQFYQVNVYVAGLQLHLV